MSMKNSIKKLYIEGMSEKDIVIRLGCSRANISYHKKQDKEQGICWVALKEEAAYSSLTSKENLDEKQQQFLTTLFNAFEKQKPLLDNIKDPIERIGVLNSFATNYYKLLKPTSNACKGVAQEASLLTINTIIDIALQEKKQEVVEFLNDHFENISTQTTLNIKKVKS